MNTDNEFVQGLISKAIRDTGSYMEPAAAVYLSKLVSDECHKIVHDYIWQTNEMVARGCLASVAHDIKKRFM